MAHLPVSLGEKRSCASNPGACMAIYHLSVRTVSRKDNERAEARFQYIKRAGRYKSDAAEVRYQCDGNMPQWAIGNERRFWAAADLYERKNGRLFKQVEWALPRELSPDAQRAAALELVQAVTQTAAGPLPFSMAIHAGHGRGNPHVHLMVSERVNDGAERGPAFWFSRAGRRTGGKEGGAKKTRTLKAPDWLLWLRQAWEAIANRALEAAGSDARIDCRTLRAQGIDRAPQTHRGPARDAIRRKLEAAAEQDADALAEANAAAVFFDEFEDADLAGLGGREPENGPEFPPLL